MDTESDSKSAIKKEKVESEGEEGNGDGKATLEEDAERDNGPPDQQMMWEELTYGMDADAMESI